jgi:hypothetical protein
MHLSVGRRLPTLNRQPELYSHVVEVVSRLRSIGNAGAQLLSAAGGFASVEQFAHSFFEGLLY